MNGDRLLMDKIVMSAEHDTNQRKCGLFYLLRAFSWYRIYKTLVTPPRTFQTTYHVIGPREDGSAITENLLIALLARRRPAGEHAAADSLSGAHAYRHGIPSIRMTHYHVTLHHKQLSGVCDV